MASPKTDRRPICSFCHEPLADTGEYIKGRAATICYTCIDTAVRMRENRVVQSEADLDFVTSIPKPKEVFSFLQKHVVGQEDTKKRLAVAIHDHCQRVHSSGETQVELRKINVLLVGPTGVGKTLLAKTLAKYLNVPFVIESAVALTEAGYVGQDVENMIHRLFEASGRNVEATERGIIYVDEVDKLAVRHQATNTTRDVGGEGVQQALLPLLEEHACTLGEKKLDKLGASEHAGTVINTKNIMFICGGAFVGLEEIVRQRVGGKRTFGFNAIHPDRAKEDQQLLMRVTAQDIIQYGFIPELVGRLPVVAPLESLTVNHLVRVLTEPENSVVKQYCERFSLDSSELTFTQGALEAIAQEAITRKSGARALESIIEDLLLEIRFELPSEEIPGSYDVSETFVHDHLQRKAIS